MKKTRIVYLKDRIKGVSIENLKPYFGKKIINSLNNGEYILIGLNDGLILGLTEAPKGWSYCSLGDFYIQDEKPKEFYEDRLWNIQFDRVCFEELIPIKERIKLIKI